MASNQTTSRKCTAAPGKYGSLPFDHLILWFPKTNSHSGPLYINSSSLSHISGMEKAAFKTKQLIKVRHEGSFYEALIMKLGSFEETRIAEYEIDQMAEKGYSTDNIMAALEDDIQIDIDAEDDADDEEYYPPEKTSTACAGNELLTSLSSRANSQKMLFKETAKERDLLATYGPRVSISPLSKTIVSSNNANNLGKALTPSHKASEASNYVPVHNGRLSGSATGPVDTVTSSPMGDPGVSICSKSTEKPIGSTAIKPEASAAHLLLLECRIQTSLLKKLVRLQEENNHLLKEGLCFKEELKNKEDKQVGAHDGTIFHLSQLPQSLTLFARSYVIKRFGEDHCQKIIIEPNGKTDRIIADADTISDIQEVLNYWFGSFSWKLVRNSLNQMFWDIRKKKKSDAE